MLVGCPDAEERFNDYLDRLPDAPTVTPQPDAGMVSSIPDISGTALMALEIAFLQGTPIQVRAEWTLTTSGDTGSIDMTLHYLSQGAREIVGSPIVINDVAVDNTASFEINVGTLSIPGAASPTTNDAVAMNVKLQGTIKSADFTCGTMTGMVTSPVPADLAGSTFGAVRATPGATGSALPTPVVKCQ